jgi:hypothetical protein
MLPVPPAWPSALTISEDDLRCVSLHHDYAGTFLHPVFKSDSCACRLPSAQDTSCSLSRILYPSPILLTVDPTPVATSCPPEFYLSVLHCTQHRAAQRMELLSNFPEVS